MRGNDSVFRIAWVLAAFLALGCAAQLQTTERMQVGPKAQELFLVRSYAATGREPNFDERRLWEDQIDERVRRYMREHPELEQTSRYSDFRFWRQVMIGSTRGEVRTLLEAPDEETIDPALMGALAQHHWGAMEKRAAEAWVYPMSWVIFFDGEGAVVDLVRRISPLEPATY